MALDVGAVFVPVLPDLKGFAPAMQKGLGAAGGGLSAVTVAAGAGALALGAFAAAGVKAALDFDKAFTKIAAISNTSAGAIDGMKESVLELSGETAVAPTELADALFFLASAGLDANQVMPALEASAKASAVGLGETADVANIVASALNAYSKSGLTAAEVTDTLVAAVREGRAEPEEFANALGRILPIASAVGVSFDQVAASMSVLSNIGLDVNEGVTAMRGVLQAIAAPGTQAADAMDKLGLSAQTLLDAIEEDGIIGALRLLDTAAKQQTTTQAGYNDALRKIIPNVRALTGVLGLTGQEADKVDAIFQNVLESSGDLGEAFRTTAESEAFKFRKALNDLALAAQKLGTRLLPLVTLGTRLLAAVAPLIAPVTALFVAFLAYKALAFIPSLLLNIAVGMEAIGAAKVGSVILNAAIGVQTFGVALGTATPLAIAFAGALTLGTAALVAWDPAHILPSMEDFNEHLEDGTIKVGHFNDAVIYGKTVLDFQGEAAATTGQSIGDMKAKAALAAAGIGSLSGTVEETSTALVHLDKSSKKAQEAIKALIPTFTAAIDPATKMKDSFTISPKELGNITRNSAKVQQTYADDLGKLDKLKIGEGLKRQLVALGPEMVHAFVQGNKGQQQKIIAALKVYDQALNATTKRLANLFGEGGTEVGRSFTAGLTTGVREGAQAVATAAAKVVTDAIQAARDAAAAASPSKKMRQLGLDLMKGLEQGIGAGLDGVISALMSAEGEWTKAWLRQAKSLQAFGDAMTKEFDKLMDKVDSFRDSIRSGLAVDLVDVLSSALAEYQQALEEFNAASAAGTLEPGQVAPTLDLGGVLAAQVAQTEAFAAALKGLSEAGLDKGLLADLASKGVSALPLAQQLLQDPALLAQFENAAKTINQIAQQTSGKLVEAAFGPALDRAAERAERFADKLSRFVKALNAEALGHEVDDVIHALHRLSNALGGPGGGGNTDKIAASFGKGQEITINVKTDLPAAVELIDQGLAGKGKNNVRLAHHGRD